jgi:hypothetical protein
VATCFWKVKSHPTLVDVLIRNADQLCLIAAKTKQYLAVKITTSAGRRWLTSVILATQEAEIRRIVVRSQPRQIVHETVSQKYPLQKKRLAEWLKVKAMSASPQYNKQKSPPMLQARVILNRTVESCDSQ